MQINDVLKIDVFHDAKVIAGKKGMGNNVSGISVLEVAGEKIGEWVLESQLYISSLYAIIQNIEEQKLVLKTLKENKASGLIICHFDLFLKEIHPDIIELCNQLEFPLIIANSDRSYVELLNPILFRLRETRNDKNYRNLISMQDRLIRYITTEGDLDYIYRTMTQEFGRKVYFLDEANVILYPKFNPNELIPQLIEKYFPQVIEEAQIFQKEYIIVNENNQKAIIFPVSMNGVQYGSIVSTYSENDNLTENLNLLRDMASMCTLIFTQTTKLRDLNVVRKQEYINDLITWNFRDENIAIERGLKVNWDIRNKSRLLIVNLNDLQTSSVQALEVILLLY